MGSSSSGGRPRPSSSSSSGQALDRAAAGQWAATGTVPARRRWRSSRPSRRSSCRGLLAGPPPRGGPPTGIDLHTRPPPGGGACGAGSAELACARAVELPASASRSRSGRPLPPGVEEGAEARLHSLGGEREVRYGPREQADQRRGSRGWGRGSAMWVPQPDGGTWEVRAWEARTLEGAALTL
ncbi:unnamed protein product [Urochloa humidicola]